MTTYALPTVLDTDAATALRSELLGRVETGQPMRLDGAHVERIGQACLQVLVSAQATAAADDLDFAITDPSEGLREMAELAGLASLFEARS